MRLTGTYDVTMDTKIGPKSIVLELSCSNGIITGTLTGDHGTCEIFDGSYTENWLTFNTVPHDTFLKFYGVLEEDGNFYGANFHKGHSSLFSGSKR